MRREIKIIVLIVLPLLLLTGCGITWDDIEKTVGKDNLNNGVSCTYYYATEKYNGVEKISFYVDNSGLYLEFNGTNRTRMANSVSKTNSYTYNNKSYTLSDGFGEAYFKSYKSNGGCPRTIYINGSNNAFGMSPVHSSGDPIKDYAYTVEATKTGSSTCHNRDVSMCENKCYKKDSMIGSSCFEWGYDKSGNKYFWISNDGTFSSIVAMKVGVTGSMVAETNMGWIKYEIAKQSINDIWLGNSVISKEDLDINREQNTEFTQIYIFKQGKTIGTGTKSDGEEQTIEGGKISGNKVTTQISTNDINYDNFCGNEGVAKVMKILGSVVQILKFVGPILIIVFGIIDYAKAVVSSDENALSKATQSLLRRIISGVVVFFIPTILWGILNLIDITDGMHDLDNTEFGTCTKCLLKNECK